MRILSGIILLLMGFNVSGQEITKQNPGGAVSKWQIGINFSPDYCYRTLENNNSSSSADFIIESRNGNENPKLGYTTGMNIQYSISNCFGLEIGVHYSNKGYRSEAGDFYFGDQIDPRYDPPYSSNDTTVIGIKSVKLVDNFHYLEFPLRGIATFGKGKIQGIASIGFITSVFLKATSTVTREYDDGEKELTTREQPYDFNAINFSPMISAGVCYEINPHLKLQAEPTLRYGITKITDTPVTAFLWNAGLNFSVYYRLP